MKTQKEMKFKTTIHCGGCIANVKPALNETAGAGNWQVDISGKDKVLTVVSEGLTEEEIIKAVKSKGYHAEVMING